MLPINDWVAHYGSGVVREHCGAIDDYVVLTSPSAWRAVRPLLPGEPRAFEFVSCQEEEFNRALLEKLPDATWVIGVGGGKALDAAKLVAREKRAKLMLVPTIVSTGSVFQANIPVRRGNQLVRIIETVAPECVLFDVDVIRSAPPHMNAAGMAECVCWIGAVASWRWWSRRGLPGDPWDESVADEVIAWVHDRVGQYAGDLDADGRPGERAIRVCAEVNRERHGLRLTGLDANRGMDHYFDNAFLWTHGRDFLHGEGVALGTLLTCGLYGSRFDEARSLLAACGTRCLPAQLGCSWPEVRAALDAIPRLGEQVKWHETILHRGAVDEAAFDAMADCLGGRAG